MKIYCIFSRSERDQSGVGGFWNNRLGWADFETATVFDEGEIGGLEMPLSAGKDARLVEIKERGRPTCGVRSVSLESVIRKIPQFEQRQDSTVNQLRDLHLVANRLGMYDAADLLKRMIET